MRQKLCVTAESALNFGIKESLSVGSTETVKSGGGGGLDIQTGEALLESRTIQHWLASISYI